MNGELISGTWVNQNGSTLEFEAENGALRGWFCSRKGRSAAGKRYPLAGVHNGEVLAFHVNWKDADANLESITSFSGRLQTDSSGRLSIHTMWTLVRRWENEERTKPTGAWNAFLTNADIFEQELE